MRYAEATHSHAQTTLRWLLTPVRRALLRIEWAPILARWWDSRAGEDYTGWTVRNRIARRTLKAGELGLVTSYERQGRHRLYTVTFQRVDLLTKLPVPEDVELVAPPDR